MCAGSFIPLHVVLLAVDLLQHPYASQGYVLFQFFTRLLSTACQTHRVEVYDFQGTYTMDAEQAARKMEVFKMSSCRALRPMYLTINMVF